MATTLRFMLDKLVALCYCANMTDGAIIANSVDNTFIPKHGRGRLTRWPKGVSGNPKGRPKKPLTDAYARLLTKKQAKQIAQAMVDNALSGGRNAVNAARELAERVEGKVPQAVNLAGADGGPLVIEVRDIGGGKSE
jgi:hypothetical protein